MITVRPAWWVEIVPLSLTAWQQVVTARLAVIVVVTSTGRGIDWATAVWSDVLLTEPKLFDAVTRTRSVWPTSAVRTPYDSAIAPPMSEQFRPPVSQRCHWKANLVGMPPVKEPTLTASASPTCAFPVIDGWALNAGGAVLDTRSLGFEFTGPVVPAPLVAVTSTTSE